LDRKKIKEVTESHVHSQAFMEDHGQKGKMVHESNPGKTTAGAGEDVKNDAPFSSQTSVFQEKAPLDNYSSVCEICKAGGELLCCDGKDCLLTYHLSCVDPPLDQVPPGDWFCPDCVSKKTYSKFSSVPPIIESIWDVKESDIILDGPCDRLTTSNASNQKQRKKEEYSQGKHLSEVEYGSPMPIVRKNGVSEATVIPTKMLADVSSHALQTIHPDGPRINSENEFKKENLYFVKYKGLAHLHNRWITESQIMKEAPKQLSTFNKKVQQGMALKWNPQWTEPHRLIRKRVLMPSKHPLDNCDNLLNRNVEWLVLWKGLGYDQCTWELEGLDILGSTSASELMKAYEKRSKGAQQRAFPRRESKMAKNLQDAAYVKLKEIPEWIRGGNSPSHQLKYINKLHKFWKTHQNAVIIDEVNQERILITIMFILLLIKEFGVVRPILVVATSTTISSWEDELLRFDSLVNFVVYNGNRNSREVIRKQEFYEESGCVMIQIVLTTCDILVADVEYLKHLEWEALIVDEFQRFNLPKSLCHLEQVPVDFRLVLFSEAPKENLSEMSLLLSFLMVEKSGQVVDTLRQDEDEEGKGGRNKVKKILDKYIIYEHKSDNLSGVKLMEHWVPVEFTNVQMEQYCNLLIRSSDLLCLLSKKNDSVERLRDLLLSLRKCCNHPYLIDPSLEISLTKRFPERECYDVGINASGKLQLLDNVLLKIKLKARRLLILYQTPSRSGFASIGDILDDHLRNRLGAESYERVDGGLAPAKKQAALQRFNCKDSGRLVFLLEKRACGPNIKLSSIDTVIIFDSDWNPLNDLRALQKTHIDTKVEHLKVFRFYSPYTVEERLLIAAKVDIEFDTNLENFNAIVCQQMLRWGAVHLFQNYDKFHGSVSPLLGSQYLYSDANLEILVEGMLDNTSSSLDLDDTLWVSLAPRVSRTHGYGKDIMLFGESEDQLIEEGKIPSNVFWKTVLNARHVDIECSSRRQQRLKNKVRYSGRPSSKSERELTDAGVKTKRRRLSDTLDPLTISSWIEDATKSISVEKERDKNVADWSIADQSSHKSSKSGNSNIKDKNLFIALHPGEHSGLSLGTFDACKELSGSDVEIVSKTSCRKTTYSSPNSQLRAVKESVKSKEPLSHKGVSNRTSTSSLEGSVYQNKESGDDHVLSLPHQNIHFRIKQEIIQLCNALQFPDEVAKMAEEFHSHVTKNYDLPIEKIGSAQALEISLCLAAANCLKHVVDIEASLKLAKSQFHFKCSRREVDLVYEELCQKFPSFKIRVPLTVAQPCNGSVFPPTNPTNRKNTEKSCLKDDKVSNDDYPTKVIHSSSVQPETNSHSSTGIDVHQLERVEAICSLGTNNNHDYLGQTSIRSPVQEEMNFHPERFVSISRKQGIDVPNQRGIPDSESDPEHNKSTQHHNVLASKNTNLMADNICAEKQKSMSPHLLKHQSEQTAFNEGSGSNKEKHKKMHNSRIDTISNTEMSMKLIEKEKNNAKKYREGNQHLHTGSGHLGIMQACCREDKNERHNSIVKGTTAKTISSLPGSRVHVELTTAETVPSQPSSRVNMELTTAETVPSKPSSRENLRLAAETVPSQPSSRVDLATDILYAQPTGIPQNGVDSPCRTSSALYTDQCSQGDGSSFLREWQPNHLSSSQQYLPLPSAETREQSQQTPQFSRFTNSLSSIQNQQYNYINISEPQNQSQHLHHTSGVCQVAMPITSSHLLESIFMEAGSTVAVTTEPSTMGLTSHPPSASFSYHSMQIGTSASSRILQPNSTDPLLHEMLRLKKENERIKKLHEEEFTQIKAQFQREFEDLKNKYDTLFQEKQLSFEQKKKYLEAILVKVSLNQRLGEMLRGNARRENNSMVSGPATRQLQSHQAARHDFGERITQVSNPTTHTGVSASGPDTLTAARGVQASGMPTSQGSGLSSRMLEGRVSSNANLPGFGSTVSSSIPVFQTPADSIVHVPAPPTSIASIITDSGNQVPNSTFTLIPSQNVTEFQPGFKLNLDVNSITRDVRQSVGGNLSMYRRTGIPVSSSCDITRGSSICASKTSQGQIEQPQSATVPPQQMNYVSDSSAIDGVICLSDDD
ncbi:hypothetical protein KI387_011917, partial [Taxus chinensis]